MVIPPAPESLTDEDLIAAVRFAQAECVCPSFVQILTRGLLASRVGGGRRDLVFLERWRQASREVLATTRREEEENSPGGEGGEEEESDGAADARQPEDDAGQRVSSASNPGKEKSDFCFPGLLATLTRLFKSDPDRILASCSDFEGLEGFLRDRIGKYGGSAVELSLSTCVLRGVSSFEAYCHEHLEVRDRLACCRAMAHLAEIYVKLCFSGLVAVPVLHKDDLKDDHHEEDPDGSCPAPRLCPQQIVVDTILELDSRFGCELIAYHVLRDRFLLLLDAWKEVQSSESSEGGDSGGDSAGEADLLLLPNFRTEVFWSQLKSSVERVMR